MDRFPHRVLIQKPSDDSNNPYVTPTYEDVYEGRCMCFLNGQSRFRSSKVMDADFCVSIPDPHMASIGENYRICIRYPQNDKEREMDYDLVGNVKDFVRYMRECYIYFQVIKENMIAEDMP